MDELIKSFNLKKIQETKINVEETINLLNEGKAILLDIREKFETKIWGFSFTLNIPLKELPDNLDKLPKDKIIITACPVGDRAIRAMLYLLYKGFNVKYLEGGLLALADRLRGGKAKDLKV